MGRGVGVGVGGSGVGVSVSVGVSVGSSVGVSVAESCDTVVAVISDAAVDGSSSSSGNVVGMDVADPPQASEIKTNVNTMLNSNQRSFFFMGK
jgi:hypothetical protein